MKAVLRICDMTSPVQVIYASQRQNGFELLNCSLAKLSSECPQNTGFARTQLGGIGRIHPIFFNDLGYKNLAPKAGVTGSNPVGCASHFRSILGT